MAKAQKTKYQRLQAAAANLCKTGTKAAKERFDKAADVYKADAIKKGKTATEVGSTITRLKKCEIISGRPGRPKKKATKKK